MGKSLSTTNAQKYWAQTDPLVDRALQALLHVEQHGRGVQEKFAARIAAEADRLALEQPRTARVSRVDLEQHAAQTFRDDITVEMRQSARDTRKAIEQSLNELKAVTAAQRRAVRKPQRPDGGVTEIERLGLSNLGEQKSIRAELRELNARMELAPFAVDELLEIAADTEADPAYRFVAEGLAGRALAQPLVYPPQPALDLAGDTLLAYQNARRAVDEKRASDLARLAAVAEARVPAAVRAREAAADAVIEGIETRWQRLRGPFRIAEEKAMPMPTPALDDEQQFAAIAVAREALIKAVETETLVEAGYVEVPA